MFSKQKIKLLFSENYPLLAVFIGVTLVSLTIGPYTNRDTQWEFDAAAGVLKWGMPYVNTFGNLMNQPPIGFYVEALFFRVVGLSIDNGAVLTVLFGLGCTFLVYKIGQVIYNKSTGLIAAVLFALTPWELILSRTFLIDVQCLFFSLLFLFVGIVAVKKGSLKLFALSGVIFAVAFLTKLYAVFALIPLLLFFAYYRPKNLKTTLVRLALFFVPVVFSAFLWYQLISGQGILAFFSHSDLIDQNASATAPTLLFAWNFLVNYGLGWFLIDAAVLSLVFLAVKRRLFQKWAAFDLICLVTVTFVVALNTFLGVALNLRAPYFNALKFDYQTLPFFCLLAASLAGKSFSLLKAAKAEIKLKKNVFIFASLAGVGLIAGAILYSIYFAHLFSTGNYLLFRVDRNVNLGYSLYNSSPIGADSVLIVVQYLGFIFVLSGLLWAGRSKLRGLLKLAFAELKPKSMRH